MKLLSIKKSTNKNKKYVAEFDNNKKVHFGHSDYGDYTTHHDKKRRENYRARAYKGKTANPDTAASLAFYILWGDSISLQQNIKEFKKIYNL
tara:strand:+ start:186 stop:461 length:276 start_codon:yes stop_codon:yes gene_type:complete